MEEPIIISQEQIPEKDIKGPLSLSEWIFKRIRPYMCGRMLELDHGTGKIAPFCKNPDFITELIQVNQTDDIFCKTYNNIIGEYDLLITLQTEHQPSFNPQIINNCARLLKREGILIIQQPASTALYEGLDAGFKTWKRQNRLYILNLLHRHFNIVKILYCLVTNQEQILAKPSTQYRERVNIFRRSLEPDLHYEGLSTIVLAQKY